MFDKNGTRDVLIVASSEYTTMIFPLVWFPLWRKTTMVWSDWIVSCSSDSTWKDFIFPIFHTKTRWGRENDVMPGSSLKNDVKIKQSVHDIGELLSPPPLFWLLSLVWQLVEVTIGLMVHSCWLLLVTFEPACLVIRANKHFFQWKNENFKKISWKRWKKIFFKFEKRWEIFLQMWIFKKKFLKSWKIFLEKMKQFLENVEKMFLENFKNFS